MHDIHVTVVSPEEASYGTAEFWSGGRMIGFTRLEDGDLMLRMEAGVVVGAHSLSGAIAEANRLLALYCPRHCARACIRRYRNAIDAETVAGPGRVEGLVRQGVGRGLADKGVSRGRQSDCSRSRSRRFEDSKAG